MVSAGPTGDNIQRDGNIHWLDLLVYDLCVSVY